jgi:hypothetical protein
MSPKINAIQHLPANGKLVIKGPIGQWAQNEVGAVFTVVVSQVAANQTIVTGVGTSEVYTEASGAAYWDSDVTVLNGGQFTDGGAVVAAWASIANTDGGWKMYPWTLPVRIVTP